MIHQHPAPSVSEPASRRRLLRLIGAGGAALIASLLPRNGVRAGHDGTDVFHIGETNFADAVTLLEGDFPPETGTSPMLAVISKQGPIGIIGHSDIGRGIEGGSDHGSDGEPGVGVSGFANNDGIGVRGRSFAGDEGHVDESPGAGPGVIGQSGSGPGVEGSSETGSGVVGHSGSGEGGHFSSDTGVALSTFGPVGIEGDRSGFLLALDNANTGLGAGGIWAISHGEKPAVAGESFDTEFGSDVGVVGVSNSGEEEGFGQGSGTGVRGDSGSGAGVVGHSNSGPGGAFDSENGPGLVATSKDVGAVVGFSENGPGGSFSSNDGIGVRGFIQGSGGPGVLGAAPGEAPGVRALSAPFSAGDFAPDSGLALEVIGKSRFSTAGWGTVPAGTNSAGVADSAVSAKSHIIVTLISDPGPRQLLWVERQPGTGFTVHLTSAPPPQRPATDFTYLIVDMP